MLKSKTLMSLLGVLILAVLAWILLNLWYIPNVGTYSCSYTPWFLGQAQAQAANDCPGTMDEAWNNEAWATQRWNEIKGKPETVGLYYDEHGERHEIRSGDEKGVDAERARAILRAAGAATIRGQYPAVTHVEVKVVAIMRESGVKRGVVVINHRRGPCEPREGEPQFGTTCSEVLPLVLAPGATLRVWWVQNGSCRSGSPTFRASDD